MDTPMPTSFDKDKVARALPERGYRLGHQIRASRDNAVFTAQRMTRDNHFVAVAVKVPVLRGNGQPRLAKMQADRRRETEIQQVVQQGPNIIGLVVTFWIKRLKLPFVITELADNSLDKLILANGPAPYEPLTCIFGQMLESIEYLGDQGIAHRNMSPSNILLKFEDVRGGQVIGFKPCDFGVATKIGAKEPELIPNMYFCPDECLPQNGCGSHETSDLFMLYVSLLFIGGFLKLDPDHPRKHFATIQDAATRAPLFLAGLSKIAGPKPENRPSVSEVIDEYYEYYTFVVKPLEQGLMPMRYRPGHRGYF